MRVDSSKMASRGPSENLSPAAEDLGGMRRGKKKVRNDNQGLSGNVSLLPREDEWMKDS